jgi:hypothetical protein
MMTDLIALMNLPTMVPEMTQREEEVVKYPTLPRNLVHIVASALLRASLHLPVGAHQSAHLMKSHLHVGEHLNDHLMIGPGESPATPKFTSVDVANPASTMNLLAEEELVISNVAVAVEAPTARSKARAGAISEHSVSSIRLSI